VCRQSAIWRKDTPQQESCRGAGVRSPTLLINAFCIIFAAASEENSMSHNLARLEKAEKDKINVELAAAGVAFKERYNMPVIPEMVEREQPEALRDWFRQRLMHYRQASLAFSRLPYEPKQK